MTSSMDSLIRKALDDVKLILDKTKSAGKCPDIKHTYNDKYILAEYLTNMSIGQLII